MATDIRQVSPSRLLVEQTDLEFIIGLENEIQALTQLKNKKAADILSRLTAGHQIEKGTHIAFLKESTDGPTHTVQLIVR